jgi:hypothetical protein
MSVQINQRALIAQLAASEPILKRQADAIIKENYFLPAVEEMKKEFSSHPVTNEIAGGIGAPNITKTLRGDFAGHEDGANLTSFIGLPDPEGALGEIEQRLDPSHKDGPKIVYRGMDKSRLMFNYEVRAPKEEAIYKATPMPWATGLSWAKRIEIGIAGLGRFLNTYKNKYSRSGGGIQVKKQIRTGRFVATSYLTQIFKNFLKRASGGKV